MVLVAAPAAASAFVVVAAASDFAGSVVALPRFGEELMLSSFFFPKKLPVKLLLRASPFMFPPLQWA